MVVKFLAGDFKDTEVWYDAGRRVLAGASLAGLPHYRYPPIFAVLIAPLCAVPWPVFFFLWYAINVVLCVVSCGLAVRLVCPDGEQAEPRLYWLPALLVGVFAVDNLFLGQTNILIMALIYWGFLEAARGREWLSGVPVGAAISMKAFPAPLLAYFLYRGQIRLVAAAVASCLFLLLLLPAPVRGLQRNLNEVVDWGRRVVMPYLSRGQAGDWGQHSFDFGNQSLGAVARRYLTEVDASVAARDDEPLHVSVANLTDRQATAAVLVLFAALGTTFLAACGWRRPRRRVEKVLEYSLATILTLLVSGLAWTYFFVMMLLPVTAALWLVRRRAELGRSSVLALRAGLWALALAVLLLSPSLRFTQYVRALGSLCWAAVIMFAGLALARRDLHKSQTSSGEASAARDQPE
jgi:hypothetical protein